MSSVASHEALKARLRSAAKDQLHRVLLDSGQVRGAVLHATSIVQEARVRHRIGPVETLLLGQALVAAGLMSSTLEAGERVKVSCECSGPVGGLTVEANSYAEVRGYLRNVPIEIRDEAVAPKLKDLFGTGQITVSRHRSFDSGAGPVSTGIIEMQQGTLAHDLAYYFATSEQTPSSFNLSVTFGDDGNVSGAGGLFLQAMPGADANRVAEIEDRLTHVESIGAQFARGTTPLQLISQTFAPYEPSIIARRRSAFVCRCARERFLAYIGALGAAELEDMLQQHDFPVQVTCAYCSTEYRFSRLELQQFLSAGSA